MEGISQSPSTNHTRSIYLAGAIEFAPDGGKAWRSRIEKFLVEKLGLRVFNPCINEVALLSPEEKQNFRHWKDNDRQRFLPVIRRIIDHDLDNILNNTQFIVCYWDEHALLGAGTAGELTLAWRHKIPVYLVAAMEPAKISSWVAGCATEVFSNLDELETYLLLRHSSIESVR